MFVLSVSATFLWYMAAPASHRRGAATNIGVTVLGIAYVPLMASYALAMLDLTDGRALVLSVIGLTFVYDTAAFIVGSWWGNRPLAPTISPKKSLEGAIGATLVVIAVSVGAEALDVVRRNPDRFKVVGLAALTNHELLVGQIREFLPPYVAIADPEAAQELREMLGQNVRAVEIIDGPDAAERLSRDVEADMVLNALVGSAGLPSTLAALQSGKTLALANQESLDIGGDLVMDLIKAEPERLVPVDSEHAALAQLLRGERKDDVKRVILTGSGGPFRGWTRNDLARASVKEALAHPVWQMGPKITIDSATLMNKGMEVIEAHYLFGIA